MKLAFIVGTLTRPPRRANTGSLTRVLASVACSFIGHGATRGTEFVDIVIDGPLAEVLLTHGKTGDEIAAVGTESLKRYRKRNNEEAFMNEVYVLDLEFIGQRRSKHTSHR